MKNVLKPRDGLDIRQETKVVVVAFVAIVTSLSLMWIAPRIATLARGMPGGGPQVVVVPMIETGSTSAVAAPLVVTKSTVVETSPPSSSSFGSTAFAIGDILKLTVFEKLAAERSATTRADSNSNVAEPVTTPQINYIERIDLSGTYVVQLDGTLYLPLLGDVTATGRARGELQQDIAVRFSADVGRPVTVSIAIHEREPVYVLGAVARPGTYKYSAHLSVDHLIALAGGYEGANQDASRLTDRLREVERHSRSVEALKHLITRQVVLLQERRDTDRVRDLSDKPKQSQLVVATFRLNEIMAADEASTLISDVQRVRALIRQSRLNEIATLDAMSANAAREISLIKEKVAVIQGAIKSRTERATRVASLERSGTQTSHMTMTAHSELGDARERQIEAMSIIVAAEMRMFQAKQKKQALEIQIEIDRERELEGLQRDIAIEEAVVIGSKNMMQVHLGPSRLPYFGDRSSFSFEVTRRTISGPIKINASETQQLQPGDLLKIIRVANLSHGN
jgi:protein involved in polysaccharide export with SLBB domain